MRRGKAREPAWARVPGALASAPADAGERYLAGTREELVIVSPGEERLSWAWEALIGAEWDRDAETLTIRTPAGAPVSVRLDAADRLLQLIRERISASVVLQQPVRVTGGTVQVIGRRRPGGAGPIAWTVDFGALDPADPVIAEEAATAVARVRAEAEV